MDEFENSNTLLEVSKSDFDSYKNLPLAVYVTSKNGLILDFNLEASRLLFLEEKDKQQKNIIDFYAHQKDRIRLIHKLEKLEHREWEKNQTLDFIVRNSPISLRFFAQAFHDSNSEFIGSLCLVFKITEFERFRQLEDTVSLGFFEVGEENKIIYANENFCNILGLRKDEPKNLLDFFPTNEAKAVYKKLIKELKLTKVIKNRSIDFVKKDNTNIVAKINVIVEESDEFNNIIKIKGTLEDITYSDILEDVPIGLFSIQQTNNSLTIRHCNNLFSEMIGKQEIQQVIGQNVKNIISSKDYDNFSEKIKKLSLSDNLLTNELINTTEDFGSRELIIHVKKSPLRDNTIMYAGAVLDITGDVEEKFSSKRKDFASYLHSYSAMSVNIVSTLDAIIDSHGSDAVKNSKIDFHLVYGRINNHISGLRSAYTNYHNLATDRGFHLTDDIFKFIEKMFEQRQDSSKLSISNIRNLVCYVKNILEEHEAYKLLPKEIIRDLNHEIAELLRYVKLLSLNYLKNEVSETILDTDQFKEALKSNDYISDFKRINIRRPLLKAIQNLQEYSERRHIEIRYHIPQKEVFVYCDERNLYQAFYNVLHNSIKYSWFKAIEKKSWVSVFIEEDEKNVILTFENKGVGILKSEIISNSLFAFGNRGITSSERSRLGNGIGLWHSKKIISSLKGDIKIDSNPLNFNSPTNFSHPFLTTVTIKLPKYND